MKLADAKARDRKWANALLNGSRIKAIAEDSGVCGMTVSWHLRGVGLRGTDRGCIEKLAGLPAAIEKKYRAQAGCGVCDEIVGTWRRAIRLCPACDPGSIRRTQPAGQAAAVMAVMKAKKAGLLPILDGSIKCSDCDKPAAQYDHRDYSRPLVVEPVCVSCNQRRGPAKPAVVTA